MRPHILVVLRDLIHYPGVGIIFLHRYGRTWCSVACRRCRPALASSPGKGWTVRHVWAPLARSGVVWVPTFDKRQGGLRALDGVTRRDMIGVARQHEEF